MLILIFKTLYFTLFYHYKNGCKVIYNIVKSRKTFWIFTFFLLFLQSK
ncbi:hypothetical protein HMPREF1146_0403 [Prevotella sp. MSX73]|nr:hypothetical protein HMPREF0649_00296 [Segatella buccae D17]EJP28649.1 hypothetical protein HMPREF1146_0403 [Prevotella sp. MSX73]